jgi:hypothetical protein
VVTVLKRIWLAAEQMCSKRLKAALPCGCRLYETEVWRSAEATRLKVLATQPRRRWIDC